MPDFTYIDSADALEKLCGRIRNEAEIALDTEFMREKTYFPRPCLIQLATSSEIACVDALTIERLEPLKEVLFDRNILKILHSARQDLEVFFHIFVGIPAPIFDTQIAASLCGFGNQTGYATIVSELLGKQVDKTHTRTDWAKRPLSESALAYAADDVRYLREIRELLCARLAKQNRLAWLDPEFAVLEDARNYEIDPTSVWRKVRGAKRVKPAGVAALIALAGWREQAASAQDKPRQWIIKDDALVSLAQRLPKNKKELQEIRGIPEEQEDKLLEIIGAAPRIPPAGMEFTEPPRLTPEQEATVDMLMAAVKLRAGEQNISAANLATRKDLEKLIRGDRRIEPLTGWRKAAIGDTLIAILDGEINLLIENNKPTLKQN
ncbi:MAG: ribonuclease D [Gammaproteobacteria bacterium]|nr:ribonuclease D [Gammaproteobacteria bacterium]